MRWRPFERRGDAKQLGTLAATTLVGQAGLVGARNLPFGNFSVSADQVRRRMSDGNRQAATDKTSIPASQSNTACSLGFLVDEPFSRE